MSTVFRASDRIRNDPRGIRFHANSRAKWGGLGRVISPIIPRSFALPLGAQP
jgi:hypothetical protein